MNRSARPLERIPGVKKAKAIVAGDSFAGDVERLLATASDLRGRVTLLEQQLRDFDADRTRWRELESNMGDLLHAVSVGSGALRRMRRDMTDLQSESDASRKAAERLAVSINEVWDHLRTVRAEVLHELRIRTIPSESTVGMEPRIVDPDRVASLAAAGPLRVNLGCGHLPLEGFVNVDMRPLPGVDAVATLDQLPFDPGTLGEIHSAHVLEHFTIAHLRARLLPYWRELLLPAGVFNAVVPDGRAMAVGLAQGSIPFENYAAVLMGGQEYEGDFHNSVFSGSTLRALLEETGFVDAEVVAEGRPLDICLEMEVRARRPG